MTSQVSSLFITAAGDMGVVTKGEPEAEQSMNINSGVGDEAPKNTIKMIQELARQLDYSTSKCNSVEALFGVELIAKRNKMKNICEQFLFEAPMSNGVLARDKLWRYVYYDTISKAKRMKQKEKWTSLDRAYLKQHMQNGIGQLSLLMLKLQSEVGIKDMKLRFCPNGLDNIMPISLIDEQNSELTSAGQEWATDIFRLLLLNIGDLCRYLCDFYVKEDQELHMSFYDRAQDYYTQAFLINPESGFAHNQLGNLSIKRNNGLDSIYYFLHSLVAKSPCQGASVNLRQLMESQLVYFATLSGSFVYKPVDTFSHNFIKMLNQLFNDTSAPFGKCEKLCQDAVTSFVILLSEGVSTLDKGYLFRAVSVSMMTVWHLLTTKSPNTSTAVCFAIGLFVHIMKRLSSILKSQSKLKEVMDMSLEEEEMNSTDDSAETAESLSKSTSSSLPPDAKDQDQTSTVELDVEAEHQRFRRRRLLRNRPRELDDYYSFIHQDEYEDEWNDNTSESTDYQRGSQSSLHTSDSESEDDSEIESEEEDEVDEDDEVESEFECIRNRRRLDSSEVSDLSYQAEIEIERKAAALKLSQSSDEVMSGFSNGKDRSMKLKSVIDVDGLHASWAEVEPLIVAVLPFTRWLQSWLPIQHALAASTEKEVMEEFCQLFNLLESTNWSVALKERWNKDGTKGEENTTFAKEIELNLIKDWKNLVDGKLEENLFSLELPEDLSMLAWNHMIPSVNNVRAKCITENNMIVTRIGRLLLFGQWLVGTEAFAVIRSEKTFLVPSVEEYKRHMRKIQIEKFSRRLRNKVFPEDAKENPDRDVKFKGKYNSGRRSRHYNRSRGDIRGPDDKVYIIFDLSAVLKYLRVIQKMARHPKFHIVLPFSVCRALDELKDGDEDGSRVARIANRWLERNSNANYKNAVQLLRKEDKKAVDNMQYPSIQTKESREFFDILECCNYIREQLNNKRPRPNVKFFKDTRDNYRVFYLSGTKNLLDSSFDSDRGFNPISTCRSAYIFLDRISRYQARGRNRRFRKALTNGHCGG